MVFSHTINITQIYLSQVITTLNVFIHPSLYFVHFVVFTKIHNFTNTHYFYNTHCLFPYHQYNITKIYVFSSYSSIVKLFAQNKDDRKKVEKGLDASGLPSGKSDTISPSKFQFEDFFTFYKNLTQRSEVEKVFETLWVEKHLFICFSGSNTTITITVHPNLWNYGER